ncbi:uncharacterized protein LOC113499942 isoform X3 [Trichoplusia ni]|uniref:Uncharacterized protein LOC113499942 isoform X3 n=1 Tax=Trichoplusia ni TaxID=7111 RepID=A0A7E5W6S3_TRINI|nr:uncharacterized protein LOC113499942 isoform X3 [Trichoplusia ni]
MKTPIKSEARKLIFNMVNKFDVKNKDNEKIFNEKEQCLVTILEAIGTENIDVNKIEESVKNLKIIHNSERIAASKYMEEISTITGVSLATIKRIKKKVN